MLNTKRKKLFAIISLCLCVIIVFTVLAYLYYPSCFVSGLYEGVEYYKDGSYSKFGHGFKRYGKIAAEYFPQYEEFSEGASSVDFIYYSGGYYFHLTITVCIYARYENEEDYLFQRAKVQGLGEYFGGQYEETNLIVDRQQRPNGENIYYIVSYCDLDRVISHMVWFDTNDYNDMFDITFSSSFCGHYSDIIHPECVELMWSQMES